jgi:hypothetical protein
VKKKSNPLPPEGVVKSAPPPPLPPPKRLIKEGVEIKKQEKAPTDLTIGFTRGVVYALARLVEMYDQPTMAIQILKTSGVDIRLAQEYDVAFLRREDPSLPHGRK